VRAVENISRPGPTRSGYRFYSPTAEDEGSRLGRWYRECSGPHRTVDLLGWIFHGRSQYFRRPNDCRHAGTGHTPSNGRIGGALWYFLLILVIWHGRRRRTRDTRSSRRTRRPRLTAVVGAPRSED